MEIINTPLKDCKIIKNISFGDERGVFMESFNKSKFIESGIPFEVEQMNFASSDKNVLRGLHFQKGDYAQSKLVGVFSGAVLDVVVDLRSGSPSFKKSFKYRLDNINDLIFVPKGFAHGYYVLEDKTKFFYLVDRPYAPNHESGIRYDDPDLDIDWDLSLEPIISEKDSKQSFLKDLI